MAEAASASSDTLPKPGRVTEGIISLVFNFMFLFHLQICDFRIIILIFI